MVCHELRRPLTVIRGAATLLLEGQYQLPAGNRDQLLGLIDRSARTMADLVDDLALVAALETGRLQFRTQTVPVAELLDAAADAARKREPGALITVFPPGDVRVEADPARSVEALSALISAALQRSPEGSATELSAEASDGRVRVLVTMPAGAVSESAGTDALALFLARALARLTSAEVAAVELPGGRFAFSFNLNRRV